MKYLIAISLHLAAFSVSGQILRNTNELTLVKEIPVKNLTGKQFRATMDIRNIPSDSTGQASFLTLQVGKGDWDYVENSLQKVAASGADTNWHSYTLSGTIKDGCHKIWLYLNPVGNGNFYFDNMVFEVEKEGGGWTGMAVPNGNFEASANPLKGIKNSDIKNKDRIKVALSKSEDNRYNQSLHVSATGGTAYTFVRYGQNNAAGKYLACGNTKIYYETYGEGEPLLLLHGNGGSISAMAGQIPELARHYRVIAVDTRGQGKSVDTLTQQFSYELFAEDMKILLDTLMLKQVNIVGWSDGGNTGLILAIQHPEYVKKLVTMGANLNPSDTSITKKIITQTRKDIAQLKTKTGTQDKVMLRLMEMMLKEPDIKVADLEKIQAKVLVLAGEKDLILDAHTRLIAASIPAAELNILKGETHMVPDENPALFNKTVLDFLRKP